MTTHEYAVRLSDTERRALHDLADAREVTPGALLGEAVRHFQGLSSRFAKVTSC